MKKILITSGCSFTFYDWNWHGHLSKKLNLQSLNSGVVSQGNGLISRKIIHSVSENLNKYKSDEIILGVMWSGIDRNELYKSNNKKVMWGWENTKNIDPRIMNPTSIVSGFNNWHIINHHWTNKESLIFYQNFHNHISSMVYTLEHILRTQHFLDKMGVNYFMTTYMDIFNDLELLIHPEIEYLYQLIDFSKFLPVKGCHEWVKEHYSNEGGFNAPDNDGYIGIHPTSFGHEKFVEEVILPYIKENKLF